MFSLLCTDLGSGSGRAVFGAVLLHNFDVYVGIELLNGLFDLSTRVLHKYNQTLRLKSKHSSDDYEIKFTRDDLFGVDWSDGSVIFVNCSTFEHHEMQIIAAQSRNIAPGSYGTSSLLARSPACEAHVASSVLPFHSHHRIQGAPLQAHGAGHYQVCDSKAAVGAYPGVVT